MRSLWRRLRAWWNEPEVLYVEGMTGWPPMPRPLPAPPPPPALAPVALTTETSSSARRTYTEPYDDMDETTRDYVIRSLELALERLRAVRRG